MNKDHNIDESANGAENTSTEHEPGIARWVRTHRAAATGIGAVATAVLVAAAVGIGWPTLGSIHATFVAPTVYRPW
jgi:hypothetical protein